MRVCDQFFINKFCSLFSRAFDDLHNFIACMAIFDPSDMRVISNNIGRRFWDI